MAAPSPEETKSRQESHLAYLASPEVQDARENAEAYAWRNDLKFDVAGMNAMLAFKYPIPENPTPTG